MLPDGAERPDVTLKFCFRTIHQDRTGTNKTPVRLSAVLMMMVQLCRASSLTAAARHSASSSSSDQIQDSHQTRVSFMETQQHEGQLLENIYKDKTETETCFLENTLNSHENSLDNSFCFTRGGDF